MRAVAILTVLAVFFALAEEGVGDKKCCNVPSQCWGTGVIYLLIFQTRYITEKIRNVASKTLGNDGK
jgi:hypothetical protein